MLDIYETDFKNGYLLERVSLSDRLLVTLKFASNIVKYENSTTRGKNKKCITPFLVKGFYRNQRVGSRDDYTINKIWIKPFFKCAYDNNLDFIDKVYGVA